MAKVSVIVPVYNVEKYLDRCMQSLLNQTLKDIEIIMVDDESPDNCPKMCDDYAKKDSRVKVIHKKNAGLGLARNSGLEVATGEYVAFVDSDDFTDVDAYRSLYENAQKRNADVVYAGFLMQHSDNTESECFVLNKEWKGKEINTFLKSLIYDSLPDKEKIWMSVWNAIYKRKVIENNNIRFLSEREYLSEDVVFHTMLLPLCRKVVCIPKTFYHYCYNGTSLTHCNFKLEKIACNFRLYEKLKETIKKNNLNSYDEAVDRENEIINNAKVILKEYADKINGLSSEYEKFIENVKKDYNSLVEKDITENEYVEECALENIKKYLSILSDSTDDYLKIRLFLPTLTNEQIEQYKKDEKNKEINDLINCLKDFLDNIKGLEYNNEITAEEINKTEKELEPENLTNISFNKKEDGVTEESINFFTNIKSVYYNGTD